MLSPEYYFSGMVTFFKATQEMPFNDVRPFAEAFSELNKLLPDLVPALGMAVVELSKYDMKTEDPLKVTLSLGQQTMFYKSKLYKAFLQERLSTRLGTARTNHKEPENSRLKEITFLLQDANLADEAKVELTCLATVFGPSDENVKVAFLLEKEERFETLRSWSPNHTLLNLQFMAQKSIAKDFLFNLFLKASVLVAKEKNSVNLVANPVLKQILGFLHKMLQIVEGSPESERLLAMALAKTAFVDIAQVKLDVAKGYVPEAPLRSNM